MMLHSEWVVFCMYLKQCVALLMSNHFVQIAEIHSSASHLPTVSIWMSFLALT